MRRALRVLGLVVVGLVQVGMPRQREPVVTPVVVERGAVAVGLVDERIVASASDDPHTNGVGAHATNHRPIVVSTQEDADLVSLVGHENPVEVRRATRNTSGGRFPNRHPKRTVGLAFDQRVILLVGAEDVHPAAQDPIERQGGVEQPIPSVAKGVFKLSAQSLLVGRGEASHRFHDDLIGQAFLKIARHPLEVRPHQLREQVPVKGPAIPRRAEYRRIVPREAYVVGQQRAAQTDEEPVDPRQGPVPVARNGLPAHRVPLLERGPAPLVGVAVPIPYEQVHQARPQVAVAVHSVTLLVFDPLEEPLRARHPCGARKPRRAVWPLVRTDLDPSQKTAELIQELAQALVPRHDDQRGVRVQDAGRFEERSDHHRAQGEQRADLVLQDALRHSLPELRIEPPGNVLVDGPKRVELAVGAPQAQRRSLEPPASTEGREPPRVAIEVEHLDFDWEGPEIAVEAAKEEPMQAPRVVPPLGSRHDRGAGPQVPGRHLDRAR